MAPKAAAKSDPDELVYTHWLLKAEPESRIEKGHDVAFSIDHFAKVGVTSWEGVRNHEAKKILKEKIKLGHEALIYHSNCKVPGVAGLGQCVKEGYPDHNAWDPNHPYYDAKSKSESPTWFMVDVEFQSKLPHFVPLKLLQHLATLPSPPSCTPYLTATQLKAIKAMALLNRGRLSCQPVTSEAFDGIVALGTKGGWEELMPTKGKGKGKAKAKEEENDNEGATEVKEDEEENAVEEEAESGTKKRKAPKKAPKAAAKKKKS